MRTTTARYPVDRYLVESSKRYDMINIIDDDIWNSEPALRPEDEIMLRKLHGMLQSTADDLKLLSGELSKYHETGIQKKTLPTPLDEDFNEKVHIEEVVNARFHGHKFDTTELTTPKIQKKAVDAIIKSKTSKSDTKQYVNHGIQVNQVSTPKKPSIKRNLKLTRTNIIQINENPLVKNSVDNYFDKSKKKNENSVAYTEFSYNYAEPQQISTTNKLQIQEMPSINIRSELKEQKVLQLDIIPDSKDISDQITINPNALVIEMKHGDVPSRPVTEHPKSFNHIKYIPDFNKDKPITRKVSKMSVCESSESTNNISSESQQNLRKQKITSRTSPRLVQKHKKNTLNKRESNRQVNNIDEWHRKLNAVYGGTSKLRNTKVKAIKSSPKKCSKEKVNNVQNLPKGLNNTEYIPYSKLTIGGVNVSDIEKEISNIPNRNEIVLSPFLDKILSSRENSFHKDSPRRKKDKSNNTKILTTSDENLLQEVLDIEKEVTKTLAEKNINNSDQSSINGQTNKNNQDSYDDDFEDEKSNDSEQIKQSQISKSASLESIPRNNSCQGDNYNNNLPSENATNQQKADTNVHNKTFTKISNLSFKNSVDIFEFIHSVDTQDTGTQSNTSIKISPRDTQTSLKIDRSTVQPIHNDLWPSIDPRGEVEKMFKLEKEFIQKLIIDEYGDILEKRFNKPSTSKNIDDENSERNVILSQKNTQTSPAHVKSVMTSPTITKTRTTSPFALSLSVDKQTSPIIVVSNEEELKVEIENEDDLGISVNLSSPRFSLRLPQTSRDVLTNIRTETNSKNRETKRNNLRKNIFSSSSSVDGDYSSSDISSLGEINKIYKRKLKKSKIPWISEISSSSSLSRYSTDPSGIVIPLRSEGEASIGQINKKKSKQNKSEGEISLGQLN